MYCSHHNGPFTGWEAEAEQLEWMSTAESAALIKRFPYLFCAPQSLELVQHYLLSLAGGSLSTK